MVLRAEYDAAQYGKEEVGSWIEEVLGAVEWLCGEGNWEMCVHDCGFEVSGLGEESLVLRGEGEGEAGEDEDDSDNDWKEGNIVLGLDLEDDDDYVNVSRDMEMGEGEADAERAEEEEL